MKKTKVLFVSHLLENTGWGDAARNYLRALASVPELDVVARPVVIQGGRTELHPEIVECLNNSDKNCEVCIQHLLPHLMTPNGKFRKNIGLFVYETSTMKYTRWPVYLEQMDELWVPNDGLVELAKEEVGRPTFKVPHACDVAKFGLDYPAINFKEIAGTYKFYFIGEFNRRKNLAALLEAFHSEFDPSEPVSLVIKTSVPGVNPREAEKQVTEFCNKVKTSIKLHKNLHDYTSEVIICDRISDEQLYGIHKSCDCLVAPSYAEAWNQPAFDAMGFGNTPIVSDVNGHKEWSKFSSFSRIVPTNQVICGAVDGSFPDMFTGRECWWSVDRQKLRSEMRAAYTNRNKPDEEKLSKYMNNYSYENIGKIMKERILNDSSN